MNSLKARLGRLHTFIESRMGKQLIFLYQTPDGKEKRGNINALISDNGTFLRVLGGNSVQDLDRLLQYETQNIHQKV